MASAAMAGTRDAAGRSWAAALSDLSVRSVGPGTSDAVHDRKGGTAIRVYPETHEALRLLAERAGQPLVQYLAWLVDQERRRVMLEECNAALARLQADPEAWAAYEAERRELDGTLADGVAGTADGDEDWSFLETATW
jgi:hypothetical protein